jgi:oligopeptide transport system permease protein
MLRYVIKRLVMMLATLFVIITATFFLMRAIPGGPFSFDRVLPPNVEASLNAKYHLDQPLMKQYLDYLGGVLRFDFGPSFVYFGQTINEMIEVGWPPSATIGVWATALILALGVPLGILSALKRDSISDRVIMVVSTVGIIVPSFVLATFLLYFFSVRLRVLPAFGNDTWKGYVLPVICLAVGSICAIARLTRSSMLDALSQDYVRTAKSKGLSPGRILRVHVLRNSLIPVVTSLGMTFAALLTGTFVIEKIFAIPGLGRYFVDSISNRDYTTVMGLTILSSVIMVVMSFLIDVIYVLIDPRIKLYDK